MSLNLNEVFPELKDKQDHYFSQEQIENMPYFKQLQVLLPQKDFTTQIKKAKRLFKLISIKKGTIIYTNSSQSNCGYFLCHGCVKLLVKKSNRQKLQSPPKHILHQVEQRVKFLNEEYGMPLNKCDLVMNQFFQDKVLFKYLEYQQIYGQGYFGIGDMVKSAVRPFMAIATQDSVLLYMTREQFDSTLKELQVKKQEVILTAMVENFNPQSAMASSNLSNFPSINQQLALKLSQCFSLFVLRSFEKDEKIFKENQACQRIYFILKGEVEISKSFSLEIPKKLIKDQNKPRVGKQVEVKVFKLSQKCYLGEVQILLHLRREFTATATQNNTIVLQIQPTAFTKIISEFSTIQRDLTLAAKQKHSIASQNYFKQKNKVTQLFLQQFQNIQNKKKQKILNNLLNDEEGQQNNNMLNQANSNMFEIFSKEGALYRDTYERLQGFEEYEQSQANKKRAAIRKYKIATSYMKGSLTEKDEGHDPTLSMLKQFNEDFEAFSSKEKLLNSPKKNLNIFELIGSATVTPQPDQMRRQSLSSQQGSSKQLKSKTKLRKFNHLQKDEAVFKRVLIKNGRYQQDKSTYKQNIAKPIVHPKFDDIIKQCMGRKNQSMRKAIGENRTDLVKDSYQSVVGELKNKSLSISKFSSYGYATTCKGTEEFKKKLEMFSRKNMKSDYQNGGIRSKVAFEEDTLKACIGVNQPPKSSYQKNRLQQNKQSPINPKFITTTNMQSSLYSGFGTRTSSQVDLSNRGRKTPTPGFNGKNNSKEKLILLNHMMKPMIYSSAQI